MLRLSETHQSIRPRNVPHSGLDMRTMPKCRPIWTTIHAITYAQMPTAPWRIVWRQPRALIQRPLMETMIDAVVYGSDGPSRDVFERLTKTCKDFGQEHPETRDL
jgi:hypothetical protein